ncbi:MAG: hypothetical protein ACJ712_11325 [Nitrososphaeraceae archaeon]
MVSLDYSSSIAPTSIIKKESALIIPKPAKLEKILASVKEVFLTTAI